MIDLELDDFFGSNVDDDIFGEKTYVSRIFKIKFKIIEIDNKYALHINYLYKNTIKELEKNIKDRLLNLFPMNIKDIHFINIEDYKLYTEYSGEFIMNYCIEDDIIDIFLNKLD